MKRTILSIFCITALAVSCKKEKVEGPQGPAGTNGTNGINGSSSPGTLAGKITQYDQNGIPYTTGLNTTTVSIDGTSYSTVTDTSGKYTISNVPPGIYDLELKKTGAGLVKIKQIIFPGNGTLYNNSSVGDKPTYIITNGYVKDSIVGSITQIAVQVNLAPANNGREILLVFGKTPNIDLGDESTFKTVNYLFVPPNQSSISNVSSMLNSGPYSYFPGGSIVYVKVYPLNPAVTGYYDQIIGQFIYTGYGTPMATTFTVTQPY